MAVTPFKYVIDAHVFALKNFENIVRLCLLISTVFTILEFVSPPIEDMGEDIDISALWYIAVVLVVSVILYPMFGVPYIQYAHAKAEQPDSKLRPNIQMSMVWNRYKTAFLIALIKIIAISVVVFGGLSFVSVALPIPPIISVIIFLIAIAFMLRLQVMPIAAALGHDSRIGTIWTLTKSYTITCVVLFIYNIGFAVIWGIVMTILSELFFYADTLWADIVGVFIQNMLSYAMGLAITHSFLTLYMAIRDTHKHSQN